VICCAVVVVLWHRQSLEVQENFFHADKFTLPKDSKIALTDSLRRRARHPISPSLPSVRRVHICEIFCPRRPWFRTPPPPEGSGAGPTGDNRRAALHVARLIGIPPARRPPGPRATEQPDGGHPLSRHTQHQRWPPGNVAAPPPHRGRGDGRGAPEGPEERPRPRTCLATSCRPRRPTSSSPAPRAQPSPLPHVRWPLAKVGGPIPSCLSDTGGLVAEGAPLHPHHPTEGARALPWFRGCPHLPPVPRPSVPLRLGSGGAPPACSRRGSRPSPTPPTPSVGSPPPPPPPGTAPAAALGTLQGEKWVNQGGGLQFEALRKGHVVNPSVWSGKERFRRFDLKSESSTYFDQLHVR